MNLLQCVLFLFGSGYLQLIVCGDFTADNRYRKELWLILTWIIYINTQQIILDVE